jgi:hypothetical protein
MQNQQVEFQFDANLGHPDRTPEHEQNEREAAELGIPYPELTRTLRLTFDGIRYEIFAAIMSWEPIDDWLFCKRCGHYLQMMPPNLLHSVPLAMCRCAGALMEPVDDRDHGLLELAYPLSESERALGERFYAELRRLRPEAFHEP